MAVVWKVETYYASPPEHPQQHPSSPPWGHQSTSSQERTLWGPQVGFASLGSSLAGWWAGPCLQGWWPPLVSPLGRGAGSCCPQGVPSWPASGLGLREGGSIWGEVQAGTGCLLATSLCRADLPCDLGVFAHLPAPLPHLMPHEVPWGHSRRSPWAVDPARPVGCAAVLGNHTPVRSVSTPFLAAVFPSQAAGAPSLQEPQCLCWNSCSNWASPLRYKQPVSLYACVCVYMYICAYTCVCIHGCVRVQMCMCVYVCMCVHVCVCAHGYVRVMCMCVCARACTYVYVCMCTQLYMYVCTCMHVCTPVRVCTCTHVCACACMSSFRDAGSQ